MLKLEKGIITGNDTEHGFEIGSEVVVVQDYVKVMGIIPTKRAVWCLGYHEEYEMMEKQKVMTDNLKITGEIEDYELDRGVISGFFRNYPEEVECVIWKKGLTVPVNLRDEFEKETNAVLYELNSTLKERGLETITDTDDMWFVSYEDGDGDISYSIIPKEYILVKEREVK